MRDYPLQKVVCLCGRALMASRGRAAGAAVLRRNVDAV